MPSFLLPQVVTDAQIGREQASPLSDSHNRATSSHDGSSSPIAPQYSPITPKVVPVLPVATVQWPDGWVKDEQPPPQDIVRDDPSTARPTFMMDDKPIAPTTQLAVSPAKPTEEKPAVAPPAQFIPQPPTQPFSGQDASDAIALRAAISTLQIQRQKAQQDLKTLDRIKKQALDDPDRFKNELAAGRLKEQPRVVPDIQAILDEDGNDDDEIFVTKNADVDMQEQSNATANDNSRAEPGQPAMQAPFPRIPAPQDVVRMPPVNWDKYGIVGEPLDRMHEQLRRWPGQTPWSTSESRGREHAVAAPYSPWLDTVDAGRAQQQGDLIGGARKDSAMSGATPTSTANEHPMSTRNRP